jgi:hypothetical protein
VRVFSTAYDSASITKVASKWRPFSFVFNQGNSEKWGGDDSLVVLVKEFPGEKEL